MAAMPVHDHKPGLLERWGLRLLRRYHARDAREPEHHREFQRLTRNWIVFATLVSFVIGFVITAALVVYEWSFPEDPAPGSSTFLEKWALLGAALAFGSGVEIYLLYIVGLRTVHQLTRLAGVHLEDPAAPTPVRLSAALARAALEIPDPNLRLYNIDSMRLVNRQSLLVRALLYRAKVILSNTLAKLLLRRLLARTALRAYASFIVAPITAVWDAAVTWIVLREVRVRLLSRILAHELAQELLHKSTQFDARTRLALLQAVGNAIVLARRFHPNLAYLLVQLHQGFGIDTRDELDQWSLFKENLQSLGPRERRLVCETLAIACAFDGELSRLERNYLNGLDADFDLNARVDAICRPIRRGDLEAARAVCRLNVL